MALSSAAAYFGERVIAQGLNYLSREPEKNLGKLIEWAELLAIQPRHKQQVRAARKLLEDKDSNWHKLAVRLLTQIHPNVRQRLAVNFFVHSGFIGVPKQQELAKKLGYSVPYAVLIDPTSRCNLRCAGCWAGDYSLHDDLSLELLDRVVSEAESLGIYLIVLSGGEPLCRKNDVMTLAERHPDCVFHLFTNGTLIDEELADRVVKTGNVTFAVSIEGFREATDKRRGVGVFDRIMKAMDIMRERGVVFGFSTTYCRNNVDEVASDDYIDMLVDKGCALGWYFTYIPVGSDSDLDLMATPEQRAYMFERVNYFRRTKPIFVVDFWNDGEASNGCIAGGRRYLHINAAGDVEPCAFIHYAVDNIKEKSLKEALGSPLMLAYQKRQPFNTNNLRPCPLIDNPDMLREIVEESGAHPTQLHDPGVEHLTGKLTDYAETWGRVADGIQKQRGRLCGP